MQTEPVQLVGDTRDALQGVRRALIELYGVVGANPETPQVVSRRYGINRNLSWKLARIINAQDPIGALNHLPGDQGIDLAMQAFERAGAPADALKPVRSAMHRLKQIIAQHAGTREQLELTLESMGVLERDTSAESGRELAFRGNSMVWGVQADARYSLSVLAPPPPGQRPGTADLAMIGGLIGFRRLRPGVQWRLFSVHACNDAGANTQGASLEEFEPKGPGDMPRCIREFCSPNMPQLIERKDKGGGRSDFLLPGGPVGRQAAFDPVFGYINRGLPRYRTPTDESGSAVTMVTLPVGTLVFDLIVHRDFSPMTPEVHVYGYPEGGPIGPATHTEQHRLPCNDRPVELAGSPPAVYTPLAPGATRMLERVFARLGVNPSEFRGWRLQIRHPPMSSIYILRWPLGAQPG